MHKLNELKAGDFIDANQYYTDIIDESLDMQEREIAAHKFLVLLCGSNYKKITYYQKIVRVFFKNKYKGIDVVLITEEYIKQLLNIRDSFEYIYSPPQSPSNQSHDTNTIGNEYRAEFAVAYGGYVELVYLVSTVFNYKPGECLSLPAQEFLFWGNYLLHKKFVENIK